MDFGLDYGKHGASRGHGQSTDEFESKTVVTSTSNCFVNRTTVGCFTYFIYLFFYVFIYLFIYLFCIQGTVACFSVV